MPNCPVCGYPKLEEEPRSASGGGSYEICPSCGFQFGVDDDDKGITFEKAREKWIAAGMNWQSKGAVAPKGWNPKEQLKTVSKVVRKPAAKPKPKSKTVAKAKAKTKVKPRTLEHFE